jgi:DNA-binding FadR family transcriptional regulator
VRFLICDREFHFAIYRCAANPLLSDFVMGLYSYLMEQRRTAMSQPGAILRSYKDHTEIMAGLCARDSVSVFSAFDRHLDRIYTTTQAILDAMGRHPSAGAGQATAKG